MTSASSDCRRSPDRRRETGAFGDLGGQNHRRESAFDRVRGARGSNARPDRGRTRAAGRRDRRSWRPHSGGSRRSRSRILDRHLRPVDVCPTGWQSEVSSSAKELDRVWRGTPAGWSTLPDSRSSRRTVRHKCGSSGESGAQSHLHCCLGLSANPNTPRDGIKPSLSGSIINVGGAFSDRCVVEEIASIG
jgi:hypothetical protein